MTPSRSSSSRAPLAIVILALLAGACAHGRRPMPPVRARFALLPPENLAGAPIPLREVAAELEVAIARAGIEVVTGDAVQEYLARHRIRYTGGIDGPAAAAAVGDLGVDGIIVTWVEQWVEGPVPATAISMRLVSVSDPPTVRWIHSVARTGEDHPGLFGLGKVNRATTLLRLSLDDVSRSLARFLDGRGVAANPCNGSRSPRWFHSSPEMPKKAHTTVLVMPFVNRTTRRGAGEIVALELSRQLLAIPGVQVLEPGVVREELLRFRIVIPEGPSLDDVLALGATLSPDLIVSGQVLEYDENGEPGVSISVEAIDGRRRRLVAHSSSYARGDDGVVFFDFGRVRTPVGVVCEMSRGMADLLLRSRPPPTSDDLAPGAPPG